MCGTTLLCLVAMAVGCSQTDTRSPGKLLDGLWTATRSKAATKSRTREVSTVEPRKHTIDDLLSFARLSEQRDQGEQAENLYRVALEREPQNPLPYHRLGVIRAKQGKFEEADELFLQALRITPDDAELISDIGYCYYLQNRLDEARQVLQRAMEIQPDNPAIGNNLAMVLGEQGRYDECFAMFRRVGTEEQAYANMAFVFAQHGKIEQAKANYSKALTLNQTLRPAAEAMAQLARYEQPRTPSPIQRPPMQTASAWPQAEQLPPHQPMPTAHADAVRPVGFEQEVLR